MKVAPDQVENIRAAQATLLQTRGGQLLLWGLIAAGHLDVENPPRSEQERAECAFACRILRSAGIELEPKAATLEVVRTDDSQGEPNE